MTKKRSSNQRLEQASRGKLTYKLNRFIVEDIDEDYGLDFQITLTNGNDSSHQDVSSLHFFIQLKASEHYRGESADFDVKTDDLELYLDETSPVVAVSSQSMSSSWFECNDAPRTAHGDRGNAVY